jgi:hypothetical protein
MSLRRTAAARAWSKRQTQRAVSEARRTSLAARPR